MTRNGAEYLVMRKLRF